MKIRIDRCLTNRVTLLTAPDGDRYRVVENFDSPVIAMVQPTDGADLAFYELRGVEVALITHDAPGGKPLIWRPLGECSAADAIVACSAGTVLS